jgi:hypothetical protein
VGYREVYGGVEEANMCRLPKVLCWFPVGFLILGLVSGCSPPPEPSAKTAALESSLLSAADVGGGFEEESRGQVGVSGDSLCPDSGFAFDDVGGVRVAFVWPTGDDDQVELVEVLHVVESGGIDTLIAGLEAAIAACDGVEWTDYGETMSLTVMTAPEIGDQSFAVRWPSELPPDERFDYGRTIYVADGDVFVEISIWETLEGATDTPVVSDDDLYQIATTAVTKLST